MDFSENKIEEMDGLLPDSLEEDFIEEEDDQKESETKDKFYDNLADTLSEAERSSLSRYILDRLDEDEKARQPWLDSILKVQPNLAFSLAEMPKPTFKYSLASYDLTYGTAVLKTYSTIRSELLSDKGLVGFEVMGETSDETEHKGELNRNYLNYHFLTKDKGYIPDSEKFIMNLITCGSITKKIYYDEDKGMLLSRFIAPNDFLINSDCTSIEDSSRITHILRLSRREILLNQQQGIYREVDLPYMKDGAVSTDNTKETSKKLQKDTDLTAYTNPSLYPITETHTYLNLKEFKVGILSDDDKKEIPVPYTVIIDKNSKELLGLYRNWKKEDESKKARNYFIHYNYLPGFGIWGLGLAHIMGWGALTATTALNMLIDAAVRKNVPGGVRVKGMGQQDNNLLIQPGEFPQIDTGDIPLRDAFVALPFAGADPVLRELMMFIIDQNKERGSIVDLGLMDTKEDVPTGTTLAILEVSNRLQSAALRSIHNAFSQEIQLVNSLLKERMEEEEFTFGEGTYTISADDFDDKVKIVPISDPASNSKIQRIIQAETLFKFMQSTPEAHNVYEVLKLNYEAQGWSLEQIEKILKPPPEETMPSPTDIITEVNNIILGEPVYPVIWQNQPACILILGNAAQRPEFQNNPEIQARFSSVIQQRQALQVVLELQMMIGHPLPPLDQITDPQMQNAIALELAQKIGEAPMDTSEEETNNMLFADAIAQKREEVEARERMEDKKLESEAYKTQLSFEETKMKVQSSEKIAEMKTQAELVKAGIPAPINE